MAENRNMLVAALGALLFLLAILVASVMTSSDQLGGTSWEMVSQEVDGSMTTAVGGPRVTLTFEEDSVQGFGGCNEYFGAYQAEGGSLSFGDMGSTLAFCEAAGISDQELAFFAHLGAVDSYRIDGGQLTLSNGSTDLVILDPARPH